MKRFWLGALLCVTVIVLSSLVAQPASSDTLRVRKSIDALSVEELTDYLYALKKLREISDSDATVKYSYAHLAGIHNIPNLFQGACEHWNPKFLAWHRALLLNFEDALRAADPPRTSNVILPYWNWSENPSGKRFPVAFENDSAAVAQKYGREIPTDLLKLLYQGNRNMIASGPEYPWPEIARIALLPAYADFVGTDSVHGQLENPPHDQLHGFIGGDLVFTDTAANDAIFWSYHAFIDLIWWWRQQRISDTGITCADCPMRGLPPTTALGTQLNPTEGKPPRLEDVFDAAKLGYTYDFPQPELETAIVMAANGTLTQRFPNLVRQALAKPDQVWSFQMTMPDSLNETLSLTLRGVDAPRSVAYVAFVYLHPVDTKFDYASAAFRDAYLVGHYAQWINEHAAHLSKANKRSFPMSVDLAAYPKLKDATGTPITVTVAIHVRGRIENVTGAAGLESTIESASAVSVSEDTKIQEVVLDAK